MAVFLRFKPDSLSGKSGEWRVAADTLRDVEGRPRRDSGSGIFAIGDDVARWVSGLAGRDYYECHLDAVELSVARVLPLRERAFSTSPPPVMTDVSDDPVHAGIADLAREVRSAHEETMWADWLSVIGDDRHPPGATGSIGMCRISAALLLPALERSYPDGGWKIAGGHPSVAYVRNRPSDARRFLRAFDGMDGGMWDREARQWDGHYWVEGTVDGQELIIDITADQYGWDPVVVTGKPDPRYRANYAAREIASDFSGPKLRDFVAANSLAVDRGPENRTPRTSRAPG